MDIHRHPMPAATAKAPHDAHLQKDIQHDGYDHNDDG